MSITSSALLVELNISVWTANKVDRNATANVTDAANAVRAAAQVRKNLMAGTSARKQIADYAASCRMWHLNKTLPWSDKGSRLLPTSLFLDYKAEANVRKATFQKMVDDMLQDYPQLVLDQRQHLGALFDAADYPSVSEIKDKFGFRLVFSPVPEAGDFRIDIAARDLAEVQEQYEVDFKQRLGDAMRAPWEQLHKMLTSMSEKLDESTEVNRRYHDTFLSNAQELCALLTHLNVTKDPKLEEARRQLERALVGTSIEDIRGDGITRQSMKQRLDTILNTYEW